MRREHGASVKFTYDDFLRFPDDGRRHEIVDGEHYVTPSPNTKHQRVSFRLSAALASYLDLQPLGEAFHAPFDVVLSMFDVVEPDLLYVSRERLGILTEKHVRGAPDLVIEILSAGTKKVDEGPKLDAYQKFGVREYWVVDPARDVVQVYRLRELALVREGKLSAARDDELTTPLLPGFSLPLRKLFAPRLRA